LNEPEYWPLQEQKRVLRRLSDLHLVFSEVNWLFAGYCMIWKLACWIRETLWLFVFDVNFDFFDALSAITLEQDSDCNVQYIAGG
jgi:hypothetical protein